MKQATALFFCPLQLLQVTPRTIFASAEPQRAPERHNPMNFIRHQVRHLRWIPLAVLLIVFFTALPDPIFQCQYSNVLYARDSTLLSATIAEDGQWRFPECDSVPYKFRQALLLFEDEHFYLHNGVYLPRLLMAARQNLASGRVVSGGSTLTMQLARLIKGNAPRTLSRKAQEMMMALRLETVCSKDQLLRLYASHAPFGGNVVGLDAAAWRYFGRTPENLSWSEAATLAVLPNAPALIFPGKNQERLLAKRNRLLRKLADRGYIDAETLALSLLEPLPGKPYPLPTHAAHLLQTCMGRFGAGHRQRSTLDANLQIRAAELLEHHMAAMRANGVFNGAVLVVETRTGKTLAYVGNTTEPGNGHANSVDCVKAPRSTGSILKPFLYAAMLQDGLLLPNALVSDIPVQLNGFAPKNYHETYDGAVPAGKALTRSLNVPAVLMLRDYGYPRFFHLLKDCGFSHMNREADHYGLSLILGGAEASLWDITHAYARLARAALSGSADRITLRHSSLNVRTFLSASDPGATEVPGDPRWNPGAAWATLNTLLEVNRPETELAWDDYPGLRPVAWKTGTSFGNRDAWAIGSTPDYIVGVWIGNADGIGRTALSGVESAAPLLFSVLGQLPSGAWFRPPYDDLTKLAVCRQSGYRCGQYCPQMDSLWVPAAGRLTPACSHHVPIHCNATGTARVTMECAGAEGVYPMPWFVLPPIEAWYYKSRHPEYLDLPPWAPGCAPSDDRVIGLIYPRGEAAIFLPRNLEGETEKTVFEATHEDPGAALYWHLDHVYIGETRGQHKTEVNASAGKHLLVIMDGEGRSLTRWVEFLERPGSPR